jgi:hypothetical protein
LFLIGDAEKIALAVEDDADVVSITVPL